MALVPRLAVGSIQADARPQPVLWALLSVLHRQGVDVQTFLSQSRFVPLDGALSITGQNHRHLDSWIMSPELGRTLFRQGTRTCDLALVEGRYDCARVDETAGGSLDSLCRWLALPRLAIIDASRLDICELPRCPGELDGVILDRVASPEQGRRLWTSVEALWACPVLGLLGELSALRGALRRLAQGVKPPADVCNRLGDRLSPSLKLDELLRLARCRQDVDPEVSEPIVEPSPWRSIRVAVAYDEAFHCYFPDTLDVLEAHGASIRVFSPLRDDALPADSDVVYFGCGRPERYASGLAANHCIKHALLRHAERGGRIYAEGGGLAYLCRHLVMKDGTAVPMSGVLPAAACSRATRRTAAAAEITLGRTTWLSPVGATLRGYLNPSWQIEISDPACSLARETELQGALLGRNQVIGSLLHLNFAAQPHFLRCFFQPQRVLGRLPRQTG